MPPHAACVNYCPPDAELWERQCVGRQVADDSSMVYHVVFSLEQCIPTRQEGCDDRGLRRASLETLDHIHVRFLFLGKRCGELETENAFCFTF